MNTYTIDNFPRTIEACMQATPSMRFRLMNQAGAFVSYEDKTAYGAAEPLQQAQLLLETLMNHDQKKNGAGGHPQMGAMQMPVGPQQAMQPPMQPPMQQMAPQAPPPMAAPIQAPMQPHPAMTPGMPAPGSFGMPQMPGMMAAPPQAPRAPAGPAPGQAMSQAPSFGMQAMPAPTFGQPPGQMHLPHTQPGFQGAPQAAQDDGRDPTPQPSGKGRGKGKGEAAPDGGASAAILKKLAENNEQIIEGLANLAEGGAHSLEMDKAIHAAVLGNAQLLKLVIIILTDFFGHMSNQPNGFQGFIPSWAQAAQNGTVEHLLQVMGQQGKV